jgi:serine/threonine-protein kinase
VIIALLASNGGGGGASTIAVPNVVGFKEIDAVNAIKAKSLNPVTLRQNDPTMPQGNVVSTDPPAGNKVAKNSTVTVNVSAGPTSTTRRTTPLTRPVTTTESPPTTESPTTPTTSSSPTNTVPIT